MADHAITIRVERFRAWLPQLAQAVEIMGEVEPGAMSDARSDRTITRLRQAYVLAARDVFAKPFGQIARAIGRCDHTGARYSYRNAQRRINDDPEFRQFANVVHAIARAIAAQPAPSVEVEPELAL